MMILRFDDDCDDNSKFLFCSCDVLLPFLLRQLYYQHQKIQLIFIFKTNNYFVFLYGHGRSHHGHQPPWQETFSKQTQTS